MDDELDFAIGVVIFSLWVVIILISTIAYKDIRSIQDQNGDGIFSVSDVNTALIEAYSSCRVWFYERLPDQLLQFMEVEAESLPSPASWIGVAEATIAWVLLLWVVVWIALRLRRIVLHFRG